MMDLGAQSCHMSSGSRVLRESIVTRAHSSVRPPTAEPALSSTGESVQAARATLKAADLGTLTDTRAVKAAAIQAGRPATWKT